MAHIGISTASTSPSLPEAPSVKPSLGPIAAGALSTPLHTSSLKTSSFTLPIPTPVPPLSVSELSSLKSRGLASAMQELSPLDFHEKLLSSVMPMSPLRAFPTEMPPPPPTALLAPAVPVEEPPGTAATPSPFEGPCTPASFSTPLVEAGPLPVPLKAACSKGELLEVPVAQPLLCALAAPAVPVCDIFIDPADPQYVATTMPELTAGPLPLPGLPPAPVQSTKALQQLAPAAAIPSVETVKRKRSSWEKYPEVAVFASTSDEDTAVLSAESCAAYGPRRAVSVPASQPNAFRKKWRKRRGHSAKVCFQLQKDTSTSTGTSDIQASVSTSSVEAAAAELTPRQRTLRRGRKPVPAADNSIAAQQSPLSCSENGIEEVRVEPYLPTVQGPLKHLTTLYMASDGNRRGPPIPQGTDWGHVLSTSQYLNAFEDRGGRFCLLAITVRGMSPLHGDLGVVHPFVRVWLLNAVTGANLVLSEAAVPCAMTQPFDIRSRKTRSPWWEAEMALRIDVEALKQCSTEAALFFEVLDCGNESLHGFYIPRSGLYPICWGYLMLHDCYGQSGKHHLQNAHVQLFPFPMRSPWYTRLVQRLLPTGLSSPGVFTPSGHAPTNPAEATGNELEVCTPLPSLPVVYQVFKNPDNRKVSYRGGLVVSVDSPDNSLYIPKPTQMLPFEEYLLNVFASCVGSCAVPRFRADSSDTQLWNSRRSTYITDSNDQRSMFQRTTVLNARALLRSYERREGERVLPPTTALQTAAVDGKVTCMAFADESPVLAVGVTRHLQHFIELRNVMQPELPVLAHLSGHTGHIHSVVFKRGGGYLLSASSDKTVRVWRFNDISGIVVEHLCTLPHSVPIYTAIFHQSNVILTGGYDTQIFCWRYDSPTAKVPDISVSGGNHLSSLLRQDHDFLSTLNATEIPAPTAEQRGTFGELIHKTTHEGDGMILSLASNGTGNRVWSVSSGGSVNCWRALYEQHRNRENIWQITVRKHSECAGATRVLVEGEHAIITCAKSPLVYIFDATTCASIRVVNTRVPPNLPFVLLPDGEAFMVGTKQGTLLAWECADGGFCTTSSGYAKVKTKFPIDEIVWANSQQLAAFRSPAPCPEQYLPNYGVSPCDGTQTHEVPLEVTLIAIAGSSAADAKVILRTDKFASEDFCAMLGGDVAMKRKTSQNTARLRALRRKQEDSEDRRKRSYGKMQSLSPSPSAQGTFPNMLAAAAETDYSEKGMRFNYVMNFWKGLVAQHRHDHNTEEKDNSTASRIAQYAQTCDED